MKSEERLKFRNEWFFAKDFHEIGRSREEHVIYLRKSKRKQKIDEFRSKNRKCKIHYGTKLNDLERESIIIGAFTDFNNNLYVKIIEKIGIISDKAFPDLSDEKKSKTLNSIFEIITKLPYELVNFDLPLFFEALLSLFLKESLSLSLIILKIFNYFLKNLKKPTKSLLKLNFIDNIFSFVSKNLQNSEIISAEVSKSLNLISNYLKVISKNSLTNLIYLSLCFVHLNEISVKNSISSLIKILKTRPESIEIFLDYEGFAIILDRFYKNSINFSEFLDIVESLTEGNKYQMFSFCNSEIFQLFLDHFEDTLLTRLQIIKIMYKISAKAKQLNAIIIDHQIFIRVIECLSSESLLVKNEVSIFIRNFFVKSKEKAKIKAISEINALIYIVDGFDIIEPESINNLLVACYWIFHTANAINHQFIGYQTKKIIEWLNTCYLHPNENISEKAEFLLKFFF